MSRVDDIFRPGGLLEQRLPGYSYREAQARMAALVERGLDEHRHVAIEAGTGIGKTYAYLIPVLLSGRRVIVSTGTKTLQDQLFARDLPALGSVLGRPVDVALLKGRNNYLCWHRLDIARADGRRHQPSKALLDSLASWGRTSNGDLSELDDFAEEPVLRGLVTSTVDNCLGGECPEVGRCFVLEARRRAQAAQVVVVNHHLLLADLALRESGFAELLPGADTIVVDEAHQLPEVAQQFFGTAVSSRAIEALLRDVTAEGREAGSGEALYQCVGDLGRGLTEAYVAAGGQSGRFAWLACPPRLLDALAALRGRLEAVSEAIAGLDAASEGLGRCRERAGEAAAKLAQIVGDERADGLRWVEVSPKSFSANWTPSDVGRALAERIEAEGANWIFTSATLAVGDDFSHFLGRVGLRDAASQALPSPFDYARNARLFIPEGLPEPREPDFIPSLMSAVWPLLEASGGGAFLLFTSYRALHAAEAWLDRRRLPGPLCVQGTGSRSQLLERFREAGNAVLLGTSSFWQGVDVRGPALRLVVIDKLPFAAPNDPLVQARVEAIRRAGGDPFNEFQLPHAALSLKQGVGRLIRDFDDRGLIVLGDRRLRGRSYGRVFLDSLPPIPEVDDLEAALDFVAELGTLSAEPDRGAHRAVEPQDALLGSR